MVPPPKNGFAVDVDVLVSKRGLKGILEEVDREEDGNRIVEVSATRGFQVVGVLLFLM